MDKIIHGDKIDIMQFLPSHLLGTTTGLFVNVVENYVNEMYKYKKDNLREQCKLSQSEYEHRLSLLGKIKDLSYLHDAKRVDYELIGRLANVVGYDFGIATTEIMNMITILSADEGESIPIGDDLENKMDELLSSCSSDPMDKATEFMRHILTELPYWYSIKGTDKLTKIFFWCFGLMMKWEYAHTRNYSLASGDWVYSDKNTKIEGMEPTPHVRASFGLDESFAQGSNIVEWLNRKGLSTVVETLASIKPLNVVIDEVVFYFTFNYTLNCAMSIAIDSFHHFKNNDSTDEKIWDGGHGLTTPRSFMVRNQPSTYKFRTLTIPSFLTGATTETVVGSVDNDGKNANDVVFTFSIPDSYYAQDLPV